MLLVRAVLASQLNCGAAQQRMTRRVRRRSCGTRAVRYGTVAGERGVSGGYDTGHVFLSSFATSSASNTASSSTLRLAGRTWAIVENRICGPLHFRVPDCPSLLLPSLVQHVNCSAYLLAMDNVTLRRRQWTGKAKTGAAGFEIL